MNPIRNLIERQTKTDNTEKLLEQISQNLIDLTNKMSMIQPQKLDIQIYLEEQVLNIDNTKYLEFKKDMDKYGIKHSIQPNQE